MGNKNTKLNLQIGNKYLIESYGILYEAYVEKITDKAYKFRIEQVDSNWIIDWVEKEKFDNNFNVIELLEESAKMPLIYNNDDDINFYKKICPICNGVGKIPADDVTTGEKPCPKCWGNGYDILL